MDEEVYGAPKVLKKTCPQIMILWIQEVCQEWGAAEDWGGIMVFICSS